MRAALALFASLALVACGGSSGTNASSGTGSSGTGTSGGEAGGTSDLPLAPIVRDSRPPRDDEAAEIERLVAITAESRGLRVVRPIAVRIASPQVVATHLVSTIEEDMLGEYVDLYVALGLLPPGTDVVALLARITAEQVVGFYDPKLDLLVIRDDVMTGFARTGSLDPEALITIVHEVVHALQGQHLDLRARMDAEQDTDPTDAYQALVEGDATLGMLLVAARIRRLPLDELLQPGMIDLAGAIASTSDAESSGFPSQELGAAPPILRIGLVAPYVVGLGFCSHLYRERGLAGLDAAHVRVPRSTEQVIHPEKYDADEAPESIGFDGLTELTDAGYRTVMEDTLGELELGIYLGQGTRSGFDAAAGAGWGGDRVRVLRRGQELAAVLVASFDTESDAEEARIAATRVELPDRTIERTGRILLATHGLDAAGVAIARAQAATLARGMEASR